MGYQVLDLYVAQTYVDAYAYYASCSIYEPPSSMDEIFYP